ncbi:hypothetical protein MKZ38_007178 [Zalerion maritima]|uniref:Uncharacterized protein n=1 Tax=Zalerion maritima TaxID=339359 RepID=A0AAD5RJ74_9PEZI|nr:hypothetical protein MKZ38_007178 [Zalerion maritima]
MSNAFNNIPDVPSTTSVTSDGTTLTFEMDIEDFKDLCKEIRIKPQYLMARITHNVPVLMEHDLPFKERTGWTPGRYLPLVPKGGKSLRTSRVKRIRPLRGMVGEKGGASLREKWEKGKKERNDKDHDHNHYRYHDQHKIEEQKEEEEKGEEEGNKNGPAVKLLERRPTALTEGALARVQAPYEKGEKSSGRKKSPETWERFMRLLKDSENKPYTPPSEPYAPWNSLFDDAVVGHTAHGDRYVKYSSLKAKGEQSVHQSRRPRVSNLSQSTDGCSNIAVFGLPVDSQIKEDFVETVLEDKRRGLAAEEGGTSCAMVPKAWGETTTPRDTKSLIESPTITSPPSNECLAAVPCDNMPGKDSKGKGKKKERAEENDWVFALSESGPSEEDSDTDDISKVACYPASPTPTNPARTSPFPAYDEGCQDALAAWSEYPPPPPPDRPYSPATVARILAAIARGDDPYCRRMTAEVVPMGSVRMIGSTGNPPARDGEREGRGEGGSSSFGSNTRAHSPAPSSSNESYVRFQNLSGPHNRKGMAKGKEPVVVTAASPPQIPGPIPTRPPRPSWIISPFEDPEPEPESEPEPEPEPPCRPRSHRLGAGGCTILSHPPMPLSPPWHPPPPPYPSPPKIGAYRGSAKARAMGVARAERERTRRKGMGMGIPVLDPDLAVEELEERERQFMKEMGTWNGTGKGEEEEEEEKPTPWYGRGHFRRRGKALKRMGGEVVGKLGFWGRKEREGSRE